MAERIIKPWGWSQEVYRDELTRVVRIHVEPGGFCSWHKHERQENHFLILSGELIVDRKIEERVQWMNYKAGAVAQVLEGDIHRFQNSSDDPVEALEVYTSIDGTTPNENDIVRFSEGGIAKQAE